MSNDKHDDQFEARLKTPYTWLYVSCARAECVLIFISF